MNFIRQIYTAELKIKESNVSIGLQRKATRLKSMGGQSLSSKENDQLN